MRPKTIAFTMVALDRDGVCEAQAPAAAGNLTINGALATTGVATMDVARHLGVYSAGDNSGRTFTITGTDRHGRSISEAITGPNAGTVSTTNNFKTCTQVAISGASTGNVEVGTTGSADTQWVPVDYIYYTPAVDIKQSADASLTAAARATMDNPWAAADFEHTAKSIAIAESRAVRAVRAEITDYVSGSLTVTVVQNAS